MCSVILNINLRGCRCFRALYYLPNLIAATSVAFLFKTLLDWRYGTFNQILNSVYQFFGVNKAPVDWLGNSGTAGSVIAVISAWMWFGNSFIMLMAGVQGINKDYFEAAAIDGAGRWTTFGKITLPLLKPIMLYVAITSLIGGLQMFDLPFLMSEKTAASYNSIETVVMYLYKFGFSTGTTQTGYASAIAYALFLIILIVSVLQLKFSQQGGLVMTTGDKIKKSVIYILLVLLAAACLFPFLLMMVNATRDGVEITHFFTLIPSTHLKENWETVFSFFNLFRGMANSLLVAVPATLLTAYFSAMTAYGLAMYRFRGNKMIFTAILVFMMIPGQLSLIGFYNLCTKLKLVNSYIPLIVPAVAAPGTVFFLRQYILSVMPPALVEAARIDGASELYSFHRIALPIMSPGIATMAIMAFIGNWNNYLLPMIILNKNEKFTLPVMMATLKASTDIQRNQGAIYLAVAISVIPILIVFCFCSKYIISSISAGSVKE